MTDTDAPEPNELDELASAVLDDEATDDERARAASDPQVHDRIEAYRALAADIGDVPPVGDDVRELLLAGAMRAADPAPLPQTAPSPTRVASLDERRNRRSSSVLPIVAVAAVVIAILAVPALLIGLNQDSGIKDMAASTADQDATVDASGAEAGTESAVSSTTTLANATANDRAATPYSVALGDLASPVELQASVEQQLATSESEDAPSTTLDLPPTTARSLDPLAAPEMFNDACETRIRTEMPDLGPLVLSGTVEYQGVPGQIYAFRTDESTPVTIVVAASDDCTVVAQTTLTPG